MRVLNTLETEGILFQWSIGSSGLHTALSLCPRANRNHREKIDRAPAIHYKKRREKETQYLVVNIELTEISRLSGSSVTVCQRPLQTQSQYRTQSTFSKEKLLTDRL